MIVGLGDDSDDGIPPLLRRPDDSSDDGIPPLLRRPTDDSSSSWSPPTFDSGQSSITIYPATVKPAPLPRVGPTKVLDSVMPKRVGAGGKVTIWGMPPAVAYALALMAVSGLGYVAYRQLGGRHHVATNPRRRRRRGGRSSRRSKR
jgi:hypothetical protein